MVDKKRAVNGWTLIRRIPQGLGIAIAVITLLTLFLFTSCVQRSRNPLPGRSANTALFACTLWLSTDRLKIEKAFGEPTKEEEVAETTIMSYDCGDGEKIKFFFNTEGETIMVQSSRDKETGSEYSRLIPGIPVFALTRPELEETIGLTSGVMYEYPGFSRAGRRTDEIWFYSLMPRGATLCVLFDAGTGDVSTITFAPRDFRDRAWGVSDEMGE
jgi:hypothetical protein